MESSKLCIIININSVTIMPSRNLIRTSPAHCSGLHVYMHFLVWMVFLRVKTCHVNMVYATCFQSITIQSNPSRPHTILD